MHHLFLGGVEVISSRDPKFSRLKVPDVVFGGANPLSGQVKLVNVESGIACDHFWVPDVYAFMSMPLFYHSRERNETAFAQERLRLPKE